MDLRKRKSSEIDQRVLKKTRKNDKPKLKKNDEELLPVHQLCHISRLPPEILSQIIKLVNNAKTIKLVCRLWYGVYNLGETTRLLRISGEVCPRFLENSEILRMEITFENVSSNSLPTIFWKKVGPKIHNLSLSRCELGQEIMKNVILYCNNLKNLKLVLKYRKADLSLGDPTTFENVNVVRKELLSLEIVNSVCSLYYRATEHDFVTWKRICIAFCKIFPNVIHNTYSPWNHTHPDSVRFTFSKDLNETSPSNLGSCLARFMCTNYRDRSTALNAFSTIRLTALSIDIFDGHETVKNGIALGNLIASQKKLTSVKIQMPYHTVEKTHNFIMEKISENCSELRKVEYYHRALTTEQKFDPEWFDCKPASEWIIKIFNNCENFSLGCTKLSDASRLELHGRQFFNKQTSLIQNFNRVQHLTLIQASDELLQSIFQHMTDLKTLKIVIRDGNTNFGLNGRRHLSNEGPSNSELKLKNSVNGYSINRLQSLEQLKIECRQCNNSTFNSDIYNEFHFPKLHYLYCFVPQDPSSFTLPSLKKFEFPYPKYDSSNPWYNYSNDSDNDSDSSWYNSKGDSSWSDYDSDSSWYDSDSDSSWYDYDRDSLRYDSDSVRKPWLVSAIIDYLVNFCRFTPNLHTLRIGYNHKTIRILTQKNAKRIFGVCPSLRILDFKGWRLYYFDPFTNKIRCHDK